MNKQHVPERGKLSRWAVTCGIAVLGGFVFEFLHMPIPWLIGPMLAVFIGSKSLKTGLYWPQFIRDTGLVIVGYSMGLSFTGQAIVEIVRQLPSMLLMTVLLVTFCAVVAVVVSKWLGIDYPTILTGSIPGGLSQMITLAEEMKGIDVTVVTFLQVARLMMIIFFVPVLIFSPLFGAGEPGAAAPPGYTASAPPDRLFPEIILFAVLCLLCAVLGKKLKLPTPYLLGPMTAAAIPSIAGVHGPALPPVVLDLSQFMIGAYIGLLLKPDKLQHKLKMISLAMISGIAMIAFSWGTSVVLAQWHGITAATSFLSLAPGGMDQMGLIAHEVRADLSVVSGYQLFRLFFIYFAVPPLLKLLFTRLSGKNR